MSNKTKRSHFCDIATWSSREETEEISGYLKYRELGLGKPPRSCYQNGFNFDDSGLKSPIRKVIDDWFGYKDSASIEFSNSSTTLFDLETKEKVTNIIPTTAASSRFNMNSFTCKRSLLHFTCRKLPGALQEREFDLLGMQTDKVFSAAWLSDHQVILGTKCQKLIVLDVNTGKKIIVPSANPLENDPGPSSQCHGIHSISINPSRTLLAVGAGKPFDKSKGFGIHIYRIPSFQPLAVLKGHSDMVFSVSWLDDQTLVSGSRDKSVKTWKVYDKDAHVECFEKNTQNDIPVIQNLFPIGSEVQHEEKVRDLVFDKQTTQLFTLSADGSVKIWDSYKSKVLASVPLGYTNETVCLALDPNQHLVSVGSQAHISIIDPRIGGIVHTFDSLDEGWGVRSMTIHQSLLSIGGGLGRVSFYDLRAQRYVSWQSGLKKKLYLESGRGWLSKDVIYQRHFHGVDVSNAVYALAYDSSFGSLFIAGGPLQLNLKGSYAALWS